MISLDDDDDDDDDDDRAAIAALPKDQRFDRPPLASEWDVVGRRYPP
jgi:hypothetical protein